MRTSSGPSYDNHQVINAIRKAIGEGPHPLHEPRLIGNEKKYLLECITSTFVSSAGPFVERFEADIASFTGAKFAVAVVNGTSALQLALRIAGVQVNDEVLVPAMSFVATASAVRHLGAIPHFADSNATTMGLDPEALRCWLDHVSEMTGEGLRNRLTGRRIVAVVPMHTFGHPCDLGGIESLARDFRLQIVEDAAEAIGSYYHGRHVGTFGVAGALSFNGNKIITTGGGGAIVTNTRSVADRARHLATTAKRPHPWEYLHDEVGYNFRMPNLNAALGCAQLEKLEEFLTSKRRLSDRYAEVFRQVPHITLMREPKDCRSNYWLQTLILDESLVPERDALLARGHAENLAMRPVWSLLNRLPPYRDCPAAPLPVAQVMERRLVNIPSSAGLA